jgi:hypothetical protein
MTAIRNQSRPVALALAVIGAMLGTGCASAVPAATNTSQASAAAAGPVDLNGTYRWTFTQEDAEKAGNPEANFEGNFPRTNTIILKDGELDGGCFGNAGGTYKVEKDRIVFHSFEYDDGATVTFTVDDQGSLHLTPVPPIDPGAAQECFSKPWTKIE